MAVNGRWEDLADRLLLEHPAHRESTQPAPEAHADLVEAVSAALSALLSDQHAADVVARRSYIHDNGFIKLVLYIADQPVGNAIEMRIHYWPEAQPPALSNVHNHTSDFRATVLSGRLESWTYGEVADHKEGCTYWDYSCSSRSSEREEYQLEPRGQVSLRDLTYSAYEAGSVHALAADVFHRVAARPGTVTLFTQGPRVASATRVLSDSPIEETGHLTSKALSIDELRSRASRILEALRVHNE